MTLGEKIKALLQEAQLYRSQGLLTEALDSITKVEELVTKASNLKNRENILHKIALKKKAISDEIQRFRKPGKVVQVSEKARDLMKEMFSFEDSETKGSAVMGGAVALEGFQQYEAAVKEFERLLRFDPFRGDAASHILSCLMKDKGPDAAIERFKQWLSDEVFKPGEIDDLRSHLQALLDDAGVKKDISNLAAGPIPEPESEVDPDDILDIGSIRFALARGPQKGDEVELEVSYQNGCIVNMIVSKREKAVVDGIKVGDIINNIDFYSPVAIFSGTGYVLNLAGIKSGPKRGDYSLSIKIISIRG